METTEEKRATFTPGPWYTYQAHKDVHRHISCKNGNTVAKEVHHANARLIAAAPAMYEALANLVADWERCIGEIPHDHEAREVLAKVEGGEG